MPLLAPPPICDDRGTNQIHRWPDEWVDGDTCHCGRFYLRRLATGEIELEETPDIVEEE